LDGWISRQVLRKASSRFLAALCCTSVSKRWRRRRASALIASSVEPHQTTGGYSRSNRRPFPELCAGTQRGTSALASQNPSISIFAILRDSRAGDCEYIAGHRMAGADRPKFLFVQLLGWQEEFACSCERNLFGGVFASQERDQFRHREIAIANHDLFARPNTLDVRTKARFQFGDVDRNHNDYYSHI